MRKYNGREWDWWVITNAHVCRLCHDEMHTVGKDAMPKEQLADMQLGRQTGLNQCDRPFRSQLYRVWRRHMKKYHPEITQQAV